MPRMRLSTGEVYDIPDSDVAMAQEQYGAVPADSAPAQPIAAPAAAGGADPLGAVAGMGASALEAIGGPRTLLTLGGLGGVGLAAKKFLNSRAAKPTAAPAEATAAPAPAGSSAARSKVIPMESQLPKGWTTVTKADLKAHPEGLKGYKEGQPIRLTNLDRLRFAKGNPGPGPTRPIVMEGKPAKAPANKPPNGPGVGVGKSRAKLAREAAYREGLPSRRAPAGTSAARAAAQAGGSDLEAQLAASLEAEQAMSKAALAPAERSFVRSGLRGVVGGAPLQLLMYLMGAGHTQEDIGAAQQMLQQVQDQQDLEQHPELVQMRRMLQGQQQGF